MAGKLEVGAVESVGSEFSGQQPDEGQLRPLRNAEGLELLLLGVFQGGRDGIHGGNKQRAPRAATGSAARY